MERMQRNELNYFQVDGSYGGNQDWFPESSMRDGGCGAVAACESCIYFASEAGKTDLYPYGTKEIDKDEYIRFAYEMKPYLCPRPNGIDTLEMFMEGFEGYLHDVGDTDLEMKPLHGEHTWQEAAEAIRGQIDHSCPIPYLLLKHKNLELDDYVWHWFMLTGYRETEEGFQVKAVTYGESKWLSLEELWDTGYERKGGMILYRM